MLALLGIVAVKSGVTFGLLRLSGARSGTAAETSLLMSSPSETTLTVLGTAASAGLIARQDAAFWQTVTALGLRPEFPFSRLQAWAQSNENAILVERRKVAPFGIYTLVCFERSASRRAA